MPDYIPVEKSSLPSFCVLRDRPIIRARDFLFPISLDLRGQSVSVKAEPLPDYPYGDE